MKEKEIIGDSALKRLGEVMGFGEETKPDCVGGKQYCGDCKVNENIIPREALLEEPDEKSCGKSSCDACNGERRILGESEKDPCKGCDGTDCPLLEKVGITCMGIEGLKAIPITEVIK